MRHWLRVTATVFALNAAPVLAQTVAPTPAKPSAPAATTAAPSQGALIDINAASKEQLDALPQIGAARAEAIIKGRPYRAKTELVDRKIIPERAYKAIRHKIIFHQKS